MEFELLKQIGQYGVLGIGLALVGVVAIQLWRDLKASWQARLDENSNLLVVIRDTNTAPNPNGYPTWLWQDFRFTAVFPPRAPVPAEAYDSWSSGYLNGRWVRMFSGERLYATFVTKNQAEEDELPTTIADWWAEYQLKKFGVNWQKGAHYQVDPQTLEPI